MEQKLPHRIAWFAPWTWKERYIVVSVLALLFVGYPLSVGPAYWLTINGWMSVTMLESAYLPLTWLEDGIPPLRHVERRYTDFFVPNN